jgi:salicylate hydroxylase
VRAKRVLVIGGGIGGLAAAGALHQFGFEVHLYERAAELGEVGAGLQLGPNAVKVLRGLGLLNRLRPMTSHITEMLSVRWNDAQLRFQQSFRDYEFEFGAPYLAAHRADLHSCLRSVLPEAKIHLSAQCTGVEMSGETAIARFANGQSAEGDILIGCDGIHSVVRESLFGKIPARFTQLIAWRGTVPIECVPQKIGPRGEVSIDPRHHYLSWIGPTGHVICYPIRGGELYNLFIGHFTSDWEEESWTVPSTVGSILEAHDGWNPALIAMLAKVENPFKWGIYDRDPLSEWSVEGITLLGDAAHPMMPTLAQGAAITLEDAVSVARHLKRESDGAIALRAYAAERLPRASGVQIQSRQQFDEFRMTPPRTPLSREWIFEHDATVG